MSPSSCKIRGEEVVYLVRQGTAKLLFELAGVNQTMQLLLELVSLQTELLNCQWINYVLSYRPHNLDSPL